MAPRQRVQRSSGVHGLCGHSNGPTVQSAPLTSRAFAPPPRRGRRAPSGAPARHLHSCQAVINDAVTSRYDVPSRLLARCGMQGTHEGRARMRAPAWARSTMVRCLTGRCGSRTWKNTAGLPHLDCSRLPQIPHPLPACADPASCEAMAQGHSLHSDTRTMPPARRHCAGMSAVMA